MLEGIVLMCLAVPGRIESISSCGSSPSGSLGASQQDALLQREGVVDFGGVARRVSLAFVPEAEVGDFVLVHAGVAIQRLDAEAAVELHEFFEAESDDLAGREERAGAVGISHGAVRREG